MFSSVPKPIIRKILALLPIADVARFSRTCKANLIYMPGKAILLKKYRVLKKIMDDLDVFDIDFCARCGTSQFSDDLFCCNVCYQCFEDWEETDGCMFCKGNLQCHCGEAAERNCWSGGKLICEKHAEEFAGVFVCLCCRV